MRRLRHLIFLLLLLPMLVHALPFGDNSHNSRSLKCEASAKVANSANTILLTCLSAYYTLHSTVTPTPAPANQCKITLPSTSILKSATNNSSGCSMITFNTTAGTNLRDSTILTCPEVDTTDDSLDYDTLNYYTDADQVNSSASSVGYFSFSKVGANFSQSKSLCGKDFPNARTIAKDQLREETAAALQDAADDYDDDNDDTSDGDDDSTDREVTTSIST